MADRQKHLSAPVSPAHSRRPSRLDLSSSNEHPDERSPLLQRSRSHIRIHNSHDTSNLKTPGLSRRNSGHGSIRSSRHLSSHPSSWSARLINAIHDRPDPMLESKGSLFSDERVWYDQFTSTDWVHDNIADAHRLKALRSRKDFRGRVHAFFDASQGWLLSFVCGVIIALIAYTITVCETTLFDWKDGNAALQTVVPSAYRMTTFDENLAAELLPALSDDENQSDENISPSQPVEEPGAPPMIYYSAAGSGVAEVRVILSGFVLHGFLGLRTLVIKSVALVLSVGSGLSLGKEGPYVHIATCVGNIACRMFSKYDSNDAKRREILSATAAAGVAVAFGAPLGGVLFGLEEVSYFFPAKTLFRTFFCCMVAALTLKFLNPYGTQKIVLFQVRYIIDWAYFELATFVVVGMLGGAAGALFIKASKYWAQSFRRIKVIKAYPMLEVLLVAIATALLSYWNVFTRLPVAKLLLNLASPCNDKDTDRDDLGLCPSEISEIPPILMSLLVAFLIKGLLTIVTFGIKVPAGIYVPSMVVGGLMGRMVGHIVQWTVMRFPHFGLWSDCAATVPGTCIQPGAYGLIAAGSTMCGVTRLSVTLAVILFELTGSLDYVLPFSLAILVAKWTADAIEPESIYDLLTNMNSYPFLDNKHKPTFTSDLADIVPRVRRERVINVTSSPLVPATSLRTKLEILHRAGELDGGLPIIRDDVLVGLIPAPDLEYALDNLEDEESTLCLMAHARPHGESIEDSGGEEDVDPTDLTPFIDAAPVALDIRSPMDLVYECFVKLGLRYICVLRDGRYAGLVHKKSFVKYIRELEEKERHGG
ncbi:DASH complex subunit dad3 [Verticillium dahliae VDG2]|nr:DASH complex subunit dad3 [Verticillium dahliae VDG2]